jgi:hypothetical protein
MKIQEKIEIVENKYIQPQQLGLILLTVLASFLVGSIPVIIGLDTTTSDTVIVPSEGELWQEVGNK